MCQESHHTENEWCRSYHDQVLRQLLVHIHGHAQYAQVQVKFWYDLCQEANGIISNTMDMEIEMSML
jgi:hypothetical protein